MASGKKKQPRLGALEWFHLGDIDHVNTAIRQIRELGIKELRTGISWADYHTEEGRKWLDWMLPKLSQHVHILPCLLYTPPSIGLEPKTSAPPKYPAYFADFTQKILKKYGNYFDWVELWNEPNNTSEYDFRLDSDWSIFCEFIGGAADVVKEHDKKVLLGGMSPIDPGWLRHMYDTGLMEKVDAVGIHGFPGTFDTHWNGWDAAVEQIREVIDHYNDDQEIWITEAGYSTWKNDDRQQVKEFSDLLQAPAERVYWYCLNDLNPQKATVDGFHIDDREYHFGLVNNNGKPKLLYRLLKDYGKDGLDRFPWITRSHDTIPDGEKSILITGGAGFIGTNLANRFLREGHCVTIFDNLERPGVESNLDQLKHTYGKNLRIEVADIRNKYKVQEAVNRAEFVYHFAAQVAVTVSCDHPVYDFDTNAKGTLNLLEAIRHTPHRPPIVYTSTNKVYGDLNSKKLTSDKKRYSMKGRQVDESEKLDFHSPYGCSKGAAESYIRDYARMYDLRTVVFRMSCIYGPHQIGTEDQGWVAHFLIQALKGNGLTIYGDGKQVRDILFIEDLVNAFLRVREEMDNISGEVFNIGGGYSNSISLKEYISLIEFLTSKKIPVTYDDWRDGDQKYYVSDTQKFTAMTGWEAEYSISDGVEKLYRWLLSSDIVELPVEFKTKIA